MTDIFLRCQKFKAEVEQSIQILQNSKDYSIDSKEDFILVHHQKQQQLNAEFSKITTKIKQLADMVNEMKESVGTQPDIIQKRKIENLIQAYKEVERNSKKTFVFKADQVQIQKILIKLKQEKERYQLFGNQECNSSGSGEGVKLILDQRSSINKSNQLVEQSLSIGSEVLLSFDRQQNSLKRISSKMSNIIGDMGFSQSLLKLLGSRQDQDCKIIVLLSIILLIFTFALYYAFKM